MAISKQEFEQHNNTKRDDKSQVQEAIFGILKGQPNSALSYEEVAREYVASYATDPLANNALAFKKAFQELIETKQVESVIIEGKGVFYSIPKGMPTFRTAFVAHIDKKYGQNEPYGLRLPREFEAHNTRVSQISGLASPTNVLMVNEANRLFALISKESKRRQAHVGFTDFVKAARAEGIHYLSAERAFENFKNDEAFLNKHSLVRVTNFGGIANALSQRVAFMDREVFVSKFGRIGSLTISDAGEGRGRENITINPPVNVTAVVHPVPAPTVWEDPEDKLFSMLAAHSKTIATNVCQTEIVRFGSLAGISSPKETLALFSKFVNDQATLSRHGLVKCTNQGGPVTKKSMRISVCDAAVFARNNPPKKVVVHERKTYTITSPVRKAYSWHMGRVIRSEKRAAGVSQKDHYKKLCLKAVAEWKANKEQIVAEFKASPGFAQMPKKDVVAPAVVKHADGSPQFEQNVVRQMIADCFPGFGNEVGVENALNQLCYFGRLSRLDFRSAYGIDSKWDLFVMRLLRFVDRVEKAYAIDKGRITFHNGTFECELKQGNK